MNVMYGNTDNISYAPILAWPDMTSTLTSHGSRNDITQHFPFIMFLVLSFDKKYPISSFDENFNGESKLLKFAIDLN